MRARLESTRGVAALITAVGVGLLVTGSGTAKSVTLITTCGQTVTTNAVLTQDLSCPSSDGIEVGASGITIDLKGHVLTGGGGNMGVYDSAGYDGVKVQNGVLRGFENGLRAINGADRLSVSNLVMSGNSIYGAFTTGDSVSIKSSNASANFYGIEVIGSSARIQSSTGNGNAVHGIAVFGASAVVQSSSVAGNGEDGIYVSGPSARIQSSTASGNEMGGIYVNGDAPRISGNHAEANGFTGSGSDNTGLGISVVGYTNPPVGSNVARGNDDPTDCVPALLC